MNSVSLPLLALPDTTVLPAPIRSRFPHLRSPNPPNSSPLTTDYGPGQFEAPHALAIDSRGRLFVADRPNSRIEIFDQDGNLLAEWKQFGRPSGLAIDKNDMLYVTDTQSTKDRPGFENGIYIGSAKDGKVTGFIPKIRPHSTWEGEGLDRTNMEAITVASDGSAIYGGEAGLRMVVKLVKNK